MDLWRAFRLYEREMFARVAAAGFDDLGAADSDILVHVGEDGIGMAALARARGVSKQAVQAPVRALVAKGYLTVGPDPKDARARIVRHDARGRALIAALAEAKASLQGEVEEALGAKGLHELRRSLATIAERLA